MSKPALSVLIDTYNHERYIEQAIVSAIEQDFPSADYEILVVDDGSTDRTPEIVRKFAPRVRLLRKKNGGQASAFNAAFPELSGEVVALLDGDDWFAQGKLTAVIRALDQHPEAAAAAHGYYEVNERTNEIKALSPGRERLLSLATRDAALDAMYGWRFLVVGSLTVRRTLLRAIIPVPDVLRFCADGPIAWASMAMGVFLFDEPLCYYRQHGTNLHAVSPENAERMRRKSEMDHLMFEQIEPLLTRLGVPKESMLAAFYPLWIAHNRSSLRAFGGTRLRTFHTEMRDFRVRYTAPSLGYRLFKYVAVGAATMMIPPPLFYRAREWYGRKNLGRLREIFVRSR